VVIDSPPVTTMADAAVLSGFCDGVILVVHGQRTPIGLARQAMERLTVVQARVLGVVLNGVDIRNPEYAYYQSYSTYADVHAADSTQSNGHAKENGYPGDNGRAHYDGDSQDPGNRPIEIKGDNPLSEKVASGHVPREFFDHMVLHLCKAAGPLAAVILDSQIDGLGETREAFPKERLKELFERVCREILNETLKQDFLRSMEGELKNVAII
jgi:hypothetical protein